MNSLKRNEKGFGAVEIILVVIILCAIGALGWYAHKSLAGINNTYNSAAKTNSNTSPKFSKTTKKSSSAVTSTNDQGYLVIKEWGIKVKLADADKITYIMNGTPNGTPNADMETSYATLKLNSSVVVPASCKDGSSIGVNISQLTAATSATKIGNYYYGFNGTVSDCGDSTTDALKQKIVSHELVPSAIVAE